MMAATRRGARTRGKSDPIDALAVARAALAEPGLPAAHLDGPARQLRLLVDYRETLIKNAPPSKAGCAGDYTNSKPAGTPPARTLSTRHPDASKKLAGRPRHRRRPGPPAT